jgi:DNA-binding Xre family transcriptional regulator
MKATDVARRAIEKATSRYAIAKRTGISESTLHRFMKGRPITTDTFDVLVEALGLKLVEGGRKRARKAGK